MNQYDLLLKAIETGNVQQIRELAGRGWISTTDLISTAYVTMGLQFSLAPYCMPM